MEDTFGALLDRLRASLQPADAPRHISPGVVDAAVVLLLKPTAARLTPFPAQVLFIKRAKRAGDPWSGHLALPGGRVEPEDASLLAGALRETLEEVGIDAGMGGHVLGRLATLAPLSPRLPPLAVTPFVVAVEADVTPRLQQEEVDDAFWLDLAVLVDGGASDVVRRTAGTQVMEFPAYPSPYGPIWGITERILSGFLALLR